MGDIHSEEDLAIEEDRRLSGMIICCAAVCSVLVGMGITAVLMRSLGVVQACGVVLTIFVLPILWAIFRRREPVNVDDFHTCQEPNGSTPLDRTCVISFWCVCSLVLLMLANQA